MFGANLESSLLSVLVEVGLEVAYFGIHILIEVFQLFCTI